MAMKQHQHSHSFSMKQTNDQKKKTRRRNRCSRSRPNIMPGTWKLRQKNVYIYIQHTYGILPFSSSFSLSSLGQNSRNVHDGARYFAFEIVFFWAFIAAAAAPKHLLPYIHSIAIEIEIHKRWNSSSSSSSSASNSILGCMQVFVLFLFDFLFWTLSRLQDFIFPCVVVPSKNSEKYANIFVPETLKREEKKPNWKHSIK